MSYQENLIPCTAYALAKFKEDHNGRYPVVKILDQDTYYYYYVKTYDSDDGTVLVESITDCFNSTWVRADCVRIVVNHPIEEKFSSYIPIKVSRSLIGKLIVVKEFYTSTDNFEKSDYDRLAGKNLKVTSVYTIAGAACVELKGYAYEIPGYCCALSPEGSVEYFEKRVAVIGDIVRTKDRLSLRVEEIDNDVLTCRIICIHTRQYEDYDPMKINREDCNVVIPAEGYRRGDVVIFTNRQYGRETNVENVGKVFTLAAAYNNHVAFRAGEISDIHKDSVELYTPEWAPNKPLVTKDGVYMTLCGRVGMEEVFIVETHTSLPGSLYSEASYVGGNSIRRAFRACGMESDVIEEELRYSFLWLRASTCIVPGGTRIVESVMVVAAIGESTYSSSVSEDTEVLWIALVKVEASKPINLCALANRFFVS